MTDKLDEIYETMLKENDNMTVGTVKPGEIEGAEKGKPVAQVSTPDNGVDAPVEGPSSEEVKKGGATANADGKKTSKPNPFPKKNEKDTTEEELKDSIDYKASRFENLYKSVIGEDLDLDDTEAVVSAPDIEGDEFNMEDGDFDPESEGEMDEEVDVATELRTMSDRLIELADKYAELTGEGGLEDELGGDDLEGLGGDDDMEAGLEEESMKSQPEPKPAQKTTLGPKMSKTVKGKLASVKKKKGQGNIKGRFDGTPQKLGDKGAKTNQSGKTVKGKGSAVAGKGDLFD